MNTQKAVSQKKSTLQQRPKEKRRSLNPGIGLAWQRFSVKYHEKSWYRLETALIAGAVVAGIGSAALSEMNRTAANEELQNRYKIVTILTSTKDLSPGVILDRSSVIESEVLASSVSTNMVSSEESESVLGRRLAIETKKGDPILLTTVEGAGYKDSIAAKIPAGKRLVTLQIKDKVAGNGWIKPNDHVDIVANLELPGRGHTSFTLLEDVTLISVGKSTVWEDGKSSAGAEIGFFVTPEEVEFVNFAQERGEFSLSLRNPKDIKQRGTSRSDMGSAGVDMTNFLDHSSVRGASGGGALPVYVKGQKKETEEIQ
jgi:pilus assembly protein CpaB